MKYTKETLTKEINTLWAILGDLGMHIPVDEQWHDMEMLEILTEIRILENLLDTFDK